MKNQLGNGEVSMKLYAVVLGKKPEYSPYVAFMDKDGLHLAVFEKRWQAVWYIRDFLRGKGAYVVRFESVNL